MDEIINSPEYHALCETDNEVNELLDLLKRGREIFKEYPGAGCDCEYCKYWIEVDSILK